MLKKETGRVYFEANIGHVKTALKIAGYNDISIEKKYYDYIEQGFYYEYIDQFDSEDELKKYIREKNPYKEWKNGVQKYFSLMINYTEISGSWEDKQKNLEKHLKNCSPINLIAKKL